jgi:hypothetical protein
MATLCSDIVTGAYQLLGRPSQEDMPYQDVLTHAGDVIRGREADLTLAARGKRLEASSWGTPTDKLETTAIFGIGIDDFLITKVEWRPVGSDDTVTPIKADVVSFERLDELGATARGTESYVAFYNNQSQVAFSESTTVLTNREYRVWYEPFTGFTAALSTNTGMPDTFITLFKYETALRCLDQVENDSESWQNKRERLRASLMPVFLTEDARFKRWTTSQYGNKVTKKQGFRSRRGRIF